MRRLTAAVGLLLLSSAWAEDLDTQRARSEIERELRRVTQAPPATIEIRFEGINSARYELLDSDFKFDAQPIASPLKPGPLGTMKQNVYFGIVSPGSHVFEAMLTFRQIPSASPLFSYVSQYKLKVPYRITLEAQRGLVLRVKTRIAADEATPNLKNRLKFVGEVAPYMVAKLEAPTPPTMPAAAGVDAGLTTTSPPGNTEKPFTQMPTGVWKVKKQRASVDNAGSKASRRRLERMRKKLRQVPDGGT